MAWKIISPVIGAQAITDNSTTQRHRLGEIVQARHETYGVGEFIYLKGIGSTVANDWVEYSDAFLTSLSSIALAGNEMLAVAMAATVANEYGWYQIGGVAQSNKASTLSVAAGAGFALTSGKVVAAATTLRVFGALAVSVSSAKSGVTTLTVVINRPHGSATTDVG